MTILYALLAVFGPPVLFGAVLYGLDALAGWHHRRQTKGKLTWK